MATLIKLTPDPLIESIVELRFSSDVVLPFEAMYGLIYSKIHKDYPTNFASNLLQLPKQIRDNEPSLKYQSFYTLSNDKVSVSIGPAAISLNCPNGYITWKEYFPTIQKVITEIKEVVSFKNFERIGLRYVNFFKNENIFDQANLNIQFSPNNYEILQTSLSTNIKTGKFVTKLIIQDKVTLNNNTGVHVGSIIDIDTAYIEKISGNNIEQVFSIIDDIHAEEKDVFKSILKDDFLAKFKPEFK